MCSADVVSDSRQLMLLVCVCLLGSLLQNLSEEVEVEAFYDFFSKFGEILQCKTDTDNYGQVRRKHTQPQQCSSSSSSI